ncbi:MAG: hypothetical protein JSS86_11485 [Cyanobacteria bacterium SZAS LIN-2]|nr:hypothetical protein [Cyanobacteria bacterium SZAS LIN-2]
MSKSKQALVVYNPTARSQASDESWIARLVAELSRQDNYVVTLYPTTPRTTIDDIIGLLKPELDLVVAAGGDGTIRSVLAALAQAKSDIPAALMPLGTGNVLARNLGIVDEKFFSDPLAHAFDPIASGVPVRIDMGLMNGEFFAGMAGAGPLSDAFMAPEREAKTAFKNLAYAKAMLETMAMRPVIFRITVAGRTFKVRASGVFVANVEDLGLGRPCELTTLTDGFLNLHVIDPRNFSDYVAVGFRFVAGHVDGNAPHYVLRVKEALIEVIPRRGLRSTFQSFVNKVRTILTGKAATTVRSQNIPAMIDGEPCGTTPMKISVVPQAVVVLVPAERLQELTATQAATQATFDQAVADATADGAQTTAQAHAQETARAVDYAKGEVTAFITAASETVE